MERNLHLDLLNEDPIIPIIKSHHDSTEREMNNSMPVFDVSDLVGLTFLMDAKEDEQRFRACIVEAIQNQEVDLASNLDRIKFLCSINDDQYEEIMSYNNILSHIEKDNDQEIT